MNYREVMQKLNSPAPPQEEPKETRGLIRRKIAQPERKEAEDPLNLMRQWMEIIRTSGESARRDADVKRKRVETLIAQDQPEKEVVGLVDKKKKKLEDEDDRKGQRKSLFGNKFNSEGYNDSNVFALEYNGSDGEYVSLARSIAKEQGLPENLFLRLIKQESGFKQSAKSNKGAMGLTQLMPDTAKYLGVNPKNPVQNLEGGARYLKEQYEKFGSWPLALAAYNAGPGAVEKHGGIPPYKETQNYVRSILSNG